MSRKIQEERVNNYIREEARQARTEANESQQELASFPEKSQVAVSDMENGKVEIGVWSLPLLTATLNKPITYFFPKEFIKEIYSSDLTPEDQEILFHFRDLYDDNLKKSVTAIVKALKDYSPIDSIKELIELTEDEIEREETIKSLLKKK